MSPARSRMPPSPGDSATLITGAGHATRPAVRRRRRRGRLATIALFLAPALVLYLLLVVFPLFQVIRYSGYKWNGLGPLDDFVGLDNFKQGIHGSRFPGPVQNRKNAWWLP